MPVIASMVERMGWKETFVALMLIGFVWAAVWYWWFRDEPATHPRMSAEECDYILAHRQPASAGAIKLPFGVMLQSGNMWLAMSQYFCSNFTFFFCLVPSIPPIRG
jgi:ACS family glucarate transporter-like MFS transporter